MRRVFLSVPKPCHQNWNDMTPVEKGKFCSACQKQVIDFTSMSDSQLAAFFKRPSGSVCGRFQKDQLNRTIEIPGKKIPWMRYFFQFTLPAFLFSLKSYGQKERPAQHKEIVSNCLSGIVGMVVETQHKTQEELDSIVIKGKVADENGNSIAYATVVVKGSETYSACDGLGNFSVKVKRHAKTTLVASAVGFESKELALRSSLPVVIKLSQQQLSGEVVVITGLVSSKAHKPTPLIEKMTDTVFRSFSIFPSPVSQNASFTIDTKKMKKGGYMFSLVSVTGVVVQTNEINIEGRSQLLSFSIEGVTSGNYYAVLSNKKSGKMYTEKLIVH